MATTMAVLIAVLVALVVGTRASGVIHPSDAVKGTINCPCADRRLCTPLRIKPRQELFAFQTVASNWRHYNWTYLTTIVLYDGLDPDMLCHAHKHNVRVVWSATDAALQSNASIDAWVQEKVSMVQHTFVDGVNVDFEYPVTENGRTADALATAVEKLSHEMHNQVKGSQVTFDVAWRPGGVDNRFYHYTRIINACDFVLVMDYDTRSQVFPPAPCVAGANAPLSTAQIGIDGYLQLVPDTSKLVLGVPWYGYDYRCNPGTKLTDTVCPIQHVPFRGVSCSDAAGMQRNFTDISILLDATKGHRTSVTVNASQGWAWFNYFDTADQSVHQVWYDVPADLRVKYAYARLRKLRGVSMWNADLVSYRSGAPYTEQAKSLWSAFDAFFLP